MHLLRLFANLKEKYDIVHMLQLESVHKIDGFSICVHAVEIISCHLFITVFFLDFATVWVVHVYIESDNLQWMRM